jgi:hypothetical protein
MSVDLADLIGNLKVQVNPPGADLFPSVSNNEWVLRLENSFWTARLDGLFGAYKAEDGTIVPIDPNTTVDLGRDAQQLVILYAAMDIVITEMRNLQSSFSAKAGPVEYTTQRSAQLLKGVLDVISGRIKSIIFLLSSYASPTIQFDAIIERTDALSSGMQWWVR